MGSVGDSYDNALMENFFSTLKIELVYRNAWRTREEATVDELERVLVDCLRVLGPNHPNTLLVRDNLARWRGDAGDPIGAAAALEQLVPDCVRVLGAEHHTTLMSRAHLARYRAEAGNPGGAVAAFQQLVTDCERILGAEHLTTLISRGYLARFRGVQAAPS